MNPNPAATNGGGRRGPQGQMLQPKERPAGPEGYGTIGRLIRLVANVYDVQLNTPEQTKWVQYAVTITTDPRPGRPPALPPKDLWKKIWAQLEQQGLFAPLVPVYDGRYMCFSPGLLPGVGDGASFPVQLPGGRNQFNVRIDTPIAIDVDELKKLYTSRTGVQRGDVDPALVALNTMMIHGFSLLYPSNRTTFYIDNPARVGLARNHDPFDAGAGIELWRGFFTSLRPTLNSLFLNVDTTTGAFVKPGSMINICCELIGRANGGPHALRGLGPLERIKLNRVIKTCRVDIDQRASVQNGQGRPRQQLKLKISKGLTVNSARQQTFNIDHNNGQTSTVSVEDYFLSQYNIRLQYPDLPLVETKPDTFYPIELCDFTPGNKFNKRLSSEQTARANPVQILKPQDRFGAIDAIRQNAIDQVTRQYAGQFDVVIGPQLKNVDGRVLRPPTIEYERGQTSNVDKGAWQVQPRGRQHLLKPGRLTSFGVLIGPGRVDPRAVHGFVDSLLAEGRNLGMSVPAAPGQAAFFATGGGSIEADFDRAIQQAEAHFRQPPQIVFAFFDGITEAYDRFKALGLERGITTQALLWSKIRNKTRDFSTLCNIILKVNVKLRGTNFRHQKGSTSGAGDNRLSWFEQNKAIIFGVDVSHMDGKPSIASVVMSVDRPAQVYIEGGVVQGLIEPSANSDSVRAKRSEIVVELESIVFGLLSRFESAYPGQAPPSLIFYRDGVSEGEWEKVLKHELGAINAACNKLKVEHPDTLVHWTPKITFVLSVKRHHIRFLPANQREGEGRNGNIPAGTVVDTGVTDPRAWTWYGAHHTAIIGTTRPTQYVVMTDDNSMTMNNLQGLTSALAHSYQRCHRAVSIPAPVYYADLLAGRFRAMIEANVAANGGAAGSAAGGTNASLDAQQRAQDLAAYLAAMADFDQGREELGRFGRGLDPSMWWL